MWLVNVILLGSFLLPASLADQQCGIKWKERQHEKDGLSDPLRFLMVDLISTATTVENGLGNLLDKFVQDDVGVKAQAAAGNAGRAAGGTAMAVGAVIGTLAPPVGALAFAGVVLGQKLRGDANKMESELRAIFRDQVLKYLDEFNKEIKEMRCFFGELKGRAEHLAIRQKLARHTAILKVLFGEEARIDEEVFKNSAEMNWDEFLSDLFSKPEQIGAKILQNPELMALGVQSLAPMDAMNKQIIDGQQMKAPFFELAGKSTGNVALRGFTFLAGAYAAVDSTVELVGIVNNWNTKPVFAKDIEDVKKRLQRTKVDVEKLLDELDATERQILLR